MIDHVNNLKLQYLVELSKLGDSCASLERHVAEWLHDHDKTIPWTRIVRPGRVTYGTWTIDLLSFVADNRERLVLKPASSYGGHNVSLGIETPQARWEEIIAAHADRADFIVQEYVPAPGERLLAEDAEHEEIAHGREP